MMQGEHSFIEMVSGALNAKPLGDAPSEWEYVLAHAEYAPVAYTRGMVSYQSAYSAEHQASFIDLSMVLCHENRPVAVWPLNMRLSGGLWTVGSNEGSVYPPLFVREVAEKTGKELINRCLDVVDELCRRTGQKTWSGMESVFADGASQWHRKIMERGAKVRRISHDLFVDLSLDLDRIRAKLRKSYKSLLSQGDRLWRVGIFDRVDHEVFEEFRGLHMQVAGRATRSLETWDLQEQAINRSEAFLVILRDDKGVMVGGGLFHTSKTEGLYAVGVYDRNLFDKPLGHVVQMKAIEHMKNIGLRWHRVGERFYPGDSINPTEKELSISHFKEGFATHMFLRLHCECNV